MRHAGMSEFWDSKWLAWDITRSEYKLAGGSKAGLLGYGNRLDNNKENLVAATFPFLGQPPGVWSVCLGEKGDLQGKAEPSGLVKLKKMDQLYDNNNVAHIDLPTPCTGVMKGGTAYNKGTFCNGGYKLVGDQVVAKGEAGCSAFDGATANLFYCESSCDVDCPSLTPAQIASGKGPNGGAIKQCQNVASRMVQKNALMHSQAAYWVSIVVVQWADLLICKTRWLSIKQQGLRNSVLNFGLFFETLLAAWLCYGGVFSVLGTQPIRFTHWMPGVPWSMMIFMYDAASEDSFLSPRRRRARDNHTKTQVRRDAEVHDAGDVARDRRRGHGRDQAPGRLDREVDLLLARAPLPPSPPRPRSI